LKFKGGSPVIAHPPCRLWGQMRFFSSAPESEKLLAFFAVEQVRKNGGILEHPASSTLWEAAKLPAPGRRDSFGGWTLFDSLDFSNSHPPDNRLKLIVLLYFSSCNLLLLNSFFSKIILLIFRRLHKFQFKTQV
jgi:hypothetical protein